MNTHYGPGDRDTSLGLSRTQYMDINHSRDNLYIHNNRAHQAPVTAAVDGVPNRFQHQQQQTMPMNGMGFNPLHAMNQNQLQQVQLQLMQMEFARMQV